MIAQFVRTLIAEWFERLSLRPYMEPVYRDLFKREIAALGIEDVFYPVGGAANHGLLYCLARIMRQSDVSSVLELGAGQTTLLLHRIKNLPGRSIDIKTFESDSGWAQEMERQTGGRIDLQPMQPLALANRKRIAWYSNAKEALQGRTYDLIVVDGPYAALPASRWNRLGFSTVLDDVLGTEFIIVIDDAQRPGEWKLSKNIQAALSAKGIRHYVGTVKSGKFQILIVSEKYKQFAYI